MTFFKKTITEIRGLIENGDLLKSLELLKNTLSDNSEFRNNLSLFLSQYNTLKKKELLNGEDIQVETNKIILRVLSMIGELKKADLSQSAFIETLLIICNENKRGEMELLFMEKYFPNREFINYGERIPAGIFDIIFLEDENGIINPPRDKEGKDLPLTPENEKRRAEMIEYIEFNAKQYFIYIGNFFPLGKYKNRVYFSNSRFSIYARLKEMLEYKKYYGH